jgi:pantoate--beta-alanine ligase
MGAVFTDKQLLAEELDRYRREGKTIGFVPTMGALHFGHISLIRRCKRETDICISSIFVNPTQFNEKADYKNYPRPVEFDIGLLNENKVDFIFLPSYDEMYPGGNEQLLRYEIGRLNEINEGALRKGHFQGVVTIVKKLLDIINPQVLYLGQKDYQQYLVLKKMINDLDVSVELKLCETVREEDGLAMSSRNALLNESERKVASVIFETLLMAKEKINCGEEIAKIKSWAKENLQKNGLVKTEYFEIANAENLENVNGYVVNQQLVLLTAVKIGKVRLIDNLLV